MTIRVTTRSGVSVESPWSDGEAFERLESAVREGLIPRQRVGFAESLLRAARTRRISEEQLRWIHVLAVEARRPRDVGIRIEFGAVIDALDRARASGISTPRIRLPSCTVKTTRDGRAIVVGRDTHMVGVVESRTLRATRDGPWIEELRSLAANPAVAGGVFGRRVGACCFCGLALTTAESVGNGYGPICAERWGLPWAGTAAATLERARRLVDEIERVRADLQS